MFEKYNNKAEITSAVLEGKLNIFDLECIKEKHPEYIDSEIMTTAYNLEIELITNRGLHCAESGSFANTFVDLEHANKLADKAKKEGYEIDIKPLENILTEAYSLAKNDDVSAFRLVEFLTDLDQMYNICDNKIEKLKAKASEYPKKIVKNTKRIARRFKKTEKNPVYRGQLVSKLKMLEDIENQGYNLDTEIRTIKEIAFNKGVKYYLEESERIKTIEPKKSQYLRSVAEINADVLNMPLSEIKE